MRNNFVISLFILLIFTTSSKISYAQNTCKVLDQDIANSYEGGCKDGLAHGKGKAKGNDSYEGEFSAGKLHGKGNYLWSDGDRYSGEYKEGVKHGKGIYTWSNGERYEGEYQDGKRHGKGVLVWPDSGRNCGNSLCNKKFIGTYENDYRKCGRMDYFNGDSYDGCYEANKKNERLGNTKHQEQQRLAADARIEREKRELAKRPFREGDSVCVMQWQGTGFCGNVDRVSGDRLKVEITKITCGGWVGQCNADPCSGGVDVGQSAQAKVKDFVWTEKYCVTSR